MGVVGTLLDGLATGGETLIVGFDDNKITGFEIG